MVKFGKHTDKVLKKMCKVVGADFDTIDFKKDNWYHDYQWTDKQEDAFRKWMINYLSSKLEARREFGLWSGAPTYIERTVAMFLLNYGWKSDR